MPMVRAMRMLNAVEAGTLTGAQLQTLLTADPGRLAELNVLLGMRGQARRVAASSTAMTAVAASSTAMAAVAASSTAMAAVAASSTAMTAVAASSTAMAAVIASSTAMTAVVASSTAMTAVAASSTAMAAVIASSTAMTAVAASSTAMTAVAASSTAMTAVWASDTAADAVMTSSAARLAVYNADTALAALQANPAQVQRQIGIGGRTTTSSNPWSGSSINIVANGTKLILLRRWYSDAEHDYINWARGSATNGAGNGPVAGSGGRTLYTGADALGCVSGTYASTGAAPTVNDVTGNFVCAANGLRRHSSDSGATQNVIYITV